VTAADIQRARIELGFETDAQLYNALGIAKGTYDKWKSGERSPPAIALTAFDMLAFLHKMGLLDAWLQQSHKKGA
jgi:DNA-binding transcriptional regulator YiaG